MADNIDGAPFRHPSRPHGGFFKKVNFVSARWPGGHCIELAGVRRHLPCGTPFFALNTWVTAKCVQSSSRAVSGEITTTMPMSSKLMAAGGHN